MSDRKYYEAYNDRYQQIHELKLQWFQSNPSPIVAEVMEAFSVMHQQNLLEIGCGEGRDAFPLLKRGYDLLATDVSAEAIRFCREAMPEYKDRFQILDCVAGNLDASFDFIFAVAVVHMLVADEDRKAFYQFIRSHLKDGGLALICTMGDGIMERQSDIRTAFDLQERIHEQTGTAVKIAGTSCRVVSFPAFRRELAENGLTVVKDGMTAIEPDFPCMMYAVVK